MWQPTDPVSAREGRKASSRNRSVQESHRKGIEYAEAGIKKYEDQIVKNKQKSLRRLAKELNLKVIELE